MSLRSLYLFWACLLIGGTLMNIALGHYGWQTWIGIPTIAINVYLYQISKEDA